MNGAMATLSIQRVAVIGAGISGIVTAAHLLAAGIEVTVYERNAAAGGVWYVTKNSYIILVSNWC
jgi:cation diffusion facilitator CzcD-associated flavoprotein CzcO